MPVNAINKQVHEKLAKQIVLATEAYADAKVAKNAIASNDYNDAIALLRSNLINIHELSLELLAEIKSTQPEGDELPF